MKTLRWTCAALVVAVLSGCFFYYGDQRLTVDLQADATWIVTGEDVLLAADASDPLGEQPHLRMVRRRRAHHRRERRRA